MPPTPKLSDESLGHGHGHGHGSHRQWQWARSADWDAHRARITELYRDRGLHLDRVIDIMAREHGFYASPRMYKTRISKWAIDKNYKAADVACMLLLKRQRAAQGKQSSFVLRGRAVDWAKIEQYLKRDSTLLRRLEAGDDLLDLVPGQAQSSGIICRTPSPSPPSSPLLQPLRATRNGGRVAPPSLSLSPPSSSLSSAASSASSASSSSSSSSSPPWQHPASFASSSSLASTSRPHQSAAALYAPHPRMPVLVLPSPPAATPVFPMEFLPAAAPATTTTATAPSYHYTMAACSAPPLAAVPSWMPSTAAVPDANLPKEMVSIIRNYCTAALNSGLWFLGPGGRCQSARDTCIGQPSGPSAAERLQAWGHRMRMARHLIGAGALDEGFGRVGQCMDELHMHLLDEDPSLLFHLLSNTFAFAHTTHFRPLAATLCAHIRDLAHIVLGPAHPIAVLFDRLDAAVGGDNNTAGISSAVFAALPLSLHCMINLFAARDPSTATSAARDAGPLCDRLFHLLHSKTPSPAPPSRPLSTTPAATSAVPPTSSVSASPLSYLHLPPSPPPTTAASPVNGVPAPPLSQSSPSASVSPVSLSLPSASALSPSSAAAHSRDLATDRISTELQLLIDNLEQSQNIHVRLRFYHTYLAYLAELALTASGSSSQTALASAPVAAAAAVAASGAASPAPAAAPVAAAVSSAYWPKYAAQPSSAYDTIAITTASQATGASATPRTIEAVSFGSVGGGSPFSDDCMDFESSMRDIDMIEIM